MTLLAKITLAAALLLSIAIPFGAFAAGEKTKGRYKKAMAINALLFCGTVIVSGAMIFLYRRRHCRIRSSKRSSRRYQRRRLHPW